MSPPKWHPYHPQRQPVLVERSYPERYIFLVLFVVLLIRIIQTLQKYRPQERFDPALDELDPELGVPPDARQQPLSIDTQTMYWNDDAGQTMGTSPGGTYHIRGRSNDDLYEAAVASLVSLQNNQPSPISPISDSRIRDLHKIQRLVAKLRTASYSTQNDPEDSPGRREVASLRRQIAEVVLSSSSNITNTPNHSLNPPPLHETAILDPPPPYHDIAHDDSTAVAVAGTTDSSECTPLVSSPESVL